MYKMKKVFNKFPEISGKIRINFRKFSARISELTTLYRNVLPVLVHSARVILVVVRVYSLVAIEILEII